MLHGWRQGGLVTRPVWNSIAQVYGQGGEIQATPHKYNDQACETDTKAGKGSINVGSKDTSAGQV